MGDTCCPLAGHGCIFYDPEFCCNWGYEECPLYKLVVDIVDYVSRFQNRDATVEKIRKILGEALLREDLQG